MQKKFSTQKVLKKIYDLENKIRNFNKEVWKYYRSKIAYIGNYYKFSQNIEILKKLLKTKETTLVKTSTDDQLWGIRLTENETKPENRKLWQGTNLLGEVLTQLRFDFLNNTFMFKILDQK